MNLRSSAQETARSLIGLGGGAARAIMHLVQKERHSLISAPTLHRTLAYPTLSHFTEDNRPTRNRGWR